MNTVTFDADNGVSVVVLLHDISPTLSDGYGGWEVIDRPKRTALTRYKGRNPFKQDIAIMFDGWKDQESQESEISKFESMAYVRPELNIQVPPKITLEGQALRTDLTWVIDSIEWDTQETIWISQGDTSVRVRQAATVHLLEFIDDQVITTPAQPAVVTPKSPVGKVTTPQGMTLKQVAQLIYSDPDKWYIIWQANQEAFGFITPDPRKVLLPGTVLQTPGGSVPYFEVT